MYHYTFQVTLKIQGPCIWAFGHCRSITLRLAPAMKHRGTLVKTSQSTTTKEHATDPSVDIPIHVDSGNTVDDQSVHSARV